VLPKVWDLKGILDLVLQILGITYAKIRVKLVKVLGEKTVSMLEKAFVFIKTLVTEGPVAAWKQIVDAIGGLWDMVIGGIKDWAITKIVTAAIMKLVTMFNPAGAIIQAIIATYNTVAFFIERIKQILAFVEAVVDSVANVANGKIDAAANWIEKAMARSIPVLLGFLARLIGLGNVSDAVKKVITAIQAKVDKGIDFVIDWVVKQAKALFGGKSDDKKDEDPKWAAGAAGVTSAVESMPPEERNAAGFGKKLAAWKKEFGFSELVLKHESDSLVIEGAMSPPKAVTKIKEPTAIIEELKDQEEIQIKTAGGGWRVVQLVKVNKETLKVEWAYIPPAVAKGTHRLVEDYGKFYRKYIPGTGFLSPKKRDAENLKLEWEDRNVARLVLNFRARDDDSQFNIPGTEWHHIHEFSGGGPNSVENLVLTSASNNLTFKKWFERPQEQIGSLERTYPLALRDYLKEKGSKDLWHAWGYACLKRHGVAAEEGQPNPKGRWRRIPAEASG
jgi:hypothetical protein